MIHESLFRVGLAVQAFSVILILVAFTRGSKRWRNAAVAVTLAGFIFGVIVLAGGTG